MFIVSSLHLQATHSSNQSNNKSTTHSSQPLVASVIKKFPTSPSNLSDIQDCEIAKKIDVKTIPRMQKVIALQYAKRRKIVPHMAQHEGFVKNSLIKVPSGYKKIQDLEIGDVIYGSDNHEKIVVDTFEQQAPQFVRLTKNNEIIHVACHQKFYLPQQNSWIAAQDITPSDIVLSTDNQHISFDAIEIINQDIDLHCLTVQDHLFKVSSQDILVHNMAVLTPQILTFICVELWQPAVCILAASVSLKNISTYSPFKEINGVITYQPSQEKLSFDYKHITLESAKKELTTIYNALKAINYKLDDQKKLLDFTPTKHNNVPSLTNITAQSEGELNTEARKVLTEYRQEKLEKLEEDICNLQIKIGLCVDECIYRKNLNIQFYNDFREQETDPFYSTGQLHPNHPYALVRKYYEHSLIDDMLMSEIEDRMREVESIIKIFEKCNKNSVIAKTTNILSLLPELKNNIEKNKSIIKSNKIEHGNIKNILRGYFYNHQPLPDPIKEIAHVKATLYKNLKDSAQSRWQYKKYEKVVEPDKKPDDDDAPRRYEKSQKHPDYKTVADIEKFLAKGISPSPQNGQTMLDSSIKTGDGARATTQNGYIVIFLITRNLPEGGSIYHGFLTTYADLEKRQRASLIELLIDAGLIKRNGKVL